MNGLETVRIDCPYCGEAIDIVVDCSVEYQRYIEDCQVCCRPMTITVSIGDNGQASVEVSHEDET